MTSDCMSLNGIQKVWVAGGFHGGSPSSVGSVGVIIRNLGHEKCSGWGPDFEQ